MTAPTPLQPSALPIPNDFLPSDSLYTLAHHTITTLPAEYLTACFDLIQLTSSAAYASSSKGWSPRAKKLEMRDKDMRYLLVVRNEASAGIPLERKDGRVEEDSIATAVDGEWEDEDSDLTDRVAGFLSYMLTTENGIPVVYVYEIHLSTSLRNLGVGACLMKAVEGIGAAQGMKKAMLTVFVSNEAAIRFYEHIGYEKWDEEYVPIKKRRLRSGIKECGKPSYVIMAMELPRKAI